MKKFLRIKLPRSEREVPLALDAEILASAALQARALRRKRLAVKMALPGAVAAAAAVAVIVYGALNPVPVVNSGSSVQPESVVIAALPETPPAVEVPTTAELLALADFSALEQESYNLAIISDFSLDGDNITI